MKLYKIWVEAYFDPGKAPDITHLGSEFTEDETWKLIAALCRMPGHVIDGLLDWFDTEGRVRQDACLEDSLTTWLKVEET